MTDVVNHEKVGEPRLLLVPRDIDEILLHGASNLPDGYTFRFDASSSHFARLISSVANLCHVLSAGAYELAHPGVAHGVMGADSSIFHDTFRRIDRSAVGIGAIAISADPLEAGARIRRYHNGIYGLDEYGNKVAAIDPNLYSQAWLPILCIMQQSAIRLGYSADELEDWYRETIVAYQCQGVSDEYLPKSYAQYVEAMAQFASRLKWTEAIDQFDQHGVSRPPIIPEFLWRRPTVKRTVNDLARASVLSGIPEESAIAIGYSQNLPAIYRVAIRVANLGVTAIARSGPKMWRHHPEIVRHIHPPRHVFDRALLRTSSYATRVLFDKGLGVPKPRLSLRSRSKVAT